MEADRGPSFQRQIRVGLKRLPKSQYILPQKKPVIFSKESGNRSLVGLHSRPTPLHDCLYANKRTVPSTIRNFTGLNTLGLRDTLIGASRLGCNVRLANKVGTKG